MDYIQEYYGLSDEQYRRLTVQHKLVLDYIIGFGSITPMDAFTYLGITKLATRISEMRKIGIQFGQDYEGGVNRYGIKVHYMRYRKAA